MYVHFSNNLNISAKFFIARIFASFVTSSAPLKRTNESGRYRCDSNKWTLACIPSDATMTVLSRNQSENGRKWTINFIRMSFGAARWSCKTVIYLQCELIDLQSRLRTGAVPFCSRDLPKPCSKCCNWTMCSLFPCPSARACMHVCSIFLFFFFPAFVRL